MFRKYVWVITVMVVAMFAWGGFTTGQAADANEYVGDNEKKCAMCHVTGYGQPGGFVSIEKTPKLANVQCEACHGPAGEHMKAPLSDKVKKAETMKKPTEANCKTCHNKESPTFKEFKYEDLKKELAGHFKKDK